MAYLLCAFKPCRTNGKMPSSCNLNFPAGITVIFVADPGDFSSTPEAAQYLNNLKYSRELPKGSSECPRVTIGKIMRQDVAIITTGRCKQPAADTTAESK
jgi:hypothetical protein